MKISSMIKGFLFGFAALFVIGSNLYAEEMAGDKTGPTVSGFIDTTFTQVTPPSPTTTTSTFAVNTAHLNVDGSNGKAGYHVELDFGTDQAAVAVNNIQEAYVTLRHDENCVVTVGKFVTFEGIEVIESGANPTITRGYLFGFAEPFSHTGIKMDHQFGKASLSVGAINGWDVITDTNQVKPAFVRVGLNLGDPLSFGLGSYFGPKTTTGLEPESSIDLTGVSKWGNLVINFQWNQGSQTVVGKPEAEWSGWGLQPVYWVNPTVWIGGRYESFEDKKAARQGTAGTLSNISISPGMKTSEATTLRAEYRQDTTSPTGGKDMTSKTASVELIYNF